MYAGIEIDILHPFMPLILWKLSSPFDREVQISVFVSYNTELFQTDFEKLLFQFLLLGANLPHSLRNSFSRMFIHSVSQNSGRAQREQGISDLSCLRLWLGVSDGSGGHGGWNWESVRSIITLI